ncbi:beta-methylgalactoside transporter inner membrane component [Nocardioides dokdonensis FR1436]|uniref:Beta-methylgalactoside transporter inner membrane component n=1 Tax=Nocardioides dokdonensis FR1436 TaxID=1300347 RepID=A0A1A9GEK9_9ACTN|nr:ABC transporter permease [Nocardioides dokdonensis]ANH36698.1 beta-methylgalactoside transporter inner membrane component [Nocardioides dokdonensis FR1436]
MSTQATEPTTTGRTVLTPKIPILLGVVTLLLGAAIAIGSQSGDTTFRISTRRDVLQLPDITVPAEATAWLSVVLMLLCTAEATRRYLARRKTPAWVPVSFSIIAMIGFLAWAAAGATLPVVGLLAGALALAVPLVFGALGGVLGERVGVVNIAIDGQLLAGAFAAALVGSVVGSAWAGLLGAMVAGALVGLVLGVFAISYFVDQVIVGVVLNVLIIGLTSFMFSQVLAPNAASLNSPPRFRPLSIPVLGEIPLVGPILFRQSILVYLLYIAVAVVTFMLYRTRWGLRVRAVGEHPQAADTVGINVTRTRYRTLIIAGATAGAGGAFYTLVSVSQFNREMTGGAGYIALAAVIFGKWDPIRATLAALLFGFASNLQGVLSVIGSPVPSEFMLMMPYVVTVFAVAGLVGRSRAPAAVGVPYRKG